MTTHRTAHRSAVTTAVYRFPTPEPEADGTLSWDATTAVTVHRARRRSGTGLGWTYSTRPRPRRSSHDHLAPARSPAGTSRHPRLLVGDAPGLPQPRAPAAWSCRPSAPSTSPCGTSRPGCWTSRWPRCSAAARDPVPVYGSGGFTTLTDTELAEQVAPTGATAGCTADENQNRRSPGAPSIDRDLARVNALRELAGPAVDLMVDANGGYPVGQARRVGAALDELGVVWFEEPVSQRRHRRPRRRTRGGALRRRRRGIRRRPLRRRPALPGGGLPATGRHPLRRLHRMAPRRRRRPGAQPADLRALRPRPARVRGRRRIPTCGTSNGSSTTPASNRCSSTAHPPCSTAPCSPPRPFPGTA